MISQNPCTPYPETSEDPASYQQENWENYLTNEQENAFCLHSPAPGISEMVFEKIEQFSEKMEEDFLPYDEELYYRAFAEDLEFPLDEELRKSEIFKFNIEHDDALYEEDSECSRRCNSEAEEEEAASISTRGSVYTGGLTSGDEQSYITDDNLFADTSFDLENELTRKATNFINGLPEDEKSYIHKIFPLLITSLQETYKTYRFPLNDEIVRTILKELLYGKVQMIGAEKTVFQGMVQREMDEMKSQRPEGMVTEDDLAASNRKEKKAPKGNRNSSNLNHLHENYVSNIFQFAKRNYPEDKEVQKLGNERNVSASNFRKLMNTKLTDDIMTRKAKARITGSGSELVENIEYWMKDGYFDQCADREKYICHKEKALRDLALSGKYCHLSMYDCYFHRKDKTLYCPYDT